VLVTTVFPQSLPFALDRNGHFGDFYIHMVLDRTESSSYRIVLVECGVEIRYYYGVSFLELTGK
jgi:hypothetical protein